MKKTFLTFVAVAFGITVAFAQTTPPSEETTTDNTSLSIDKMSAKPEEAARRALTVEELPEAVQQQLKREEFSAFKIVSVTEVQPQADAEPAGVQYEIALLESEAETSAEPSLVVFFDEQGQLLSHSEGQDEANAPKTVGE